MDTQKLQTLPPPPGVIASLQAGFNVVSGRIALIALPLILDVFLWLGPRVSVGNWYGSLFENWINLLRQNGFPAKEIARYAENGPIVVEFFNKLNWLGWIRTLPIGIPALTLNLPEALPVKTPLGPQDVIQLQSFLAAIAFIAVLTFIGWLAGGWYFRVVAGASLGEEAGIGLLRAFIQTILLSIIWGIVSMILFVPVVLGISLLGLISALLAQVVLFILLFFAFWLIVPLFFMPHGIFVRRQNAIVSILGSLRMSRFTLPTSSMFVLSVFLLSRGLDYLWMAPSNDSWLMLVGIAGHAFISTTLLAASFVYYRDMNNWLQNVYEKFQQMSNQSSTRKA